MKPCKHCLKEAREYFKRDHMSDSHVREEYEVTGARTVDAVKTSLKFHDCMDESDHLKLLVELIKAVRAIAGLTSVCERNEEKTR